MRGTVEDSRWEKWKQEKIRDGKGERLSVQGAGAFWKEKDDRRRARRVRTRVCKTENEVGDGEEGGKRVSGWFIESLSGAVDLCAVEGAGGGAFI